LQTTVKVTLTAQVQAFKQKNVINLPTMDRLCIADELVYIHNDQVVFIKEMPKKHKHAVIPPKR